MVKKNIFLAKGVGPVRPVSVVIGEERKEKVKKTKRSKKNNKNKICPTIGWVDALLGGLGSSRLKARVACQKGGLTKKTFFSKKTKRDPKR